MTTTHSHSYTDRVAAELAAAQAELDAATAANDYNTRACAQASVNRYTAEYGAALTEHLRLQHGNDRPDEPWPYAHELVAHHDALHAAVAS